MEDSPGSGVVGESQFGPALNLHRQRDALGTGPWPRKLLERGIASGVVQSLAVNIHREARDALGGVRTKRVLELKLSGSPSVKRSLHCRGAVKEGKEGGIYCLRRRGIGDITCALREEKVLQSRSIELGQRAGAGVKNRRQILRSSLLGSLGAEGKLGFERAHLRAQTRATHRARFQDSSNRGNGGQEQILDRLIDVALLINLESLANLIGGLLGGGNIVEALGLRGILVTRAAVGTVQADLEAAETRDVRLVGVSNILILAVR